MKLLKRAKMSNQIFRKLIKKIFNKKLIKIYSFITILIIFIPIIIYGENYTTSSQNMGNIKETTTIVNSYTVYALEPLHYSFIRFTIESGEFKIVGSITASTSIYLYLLNSSNFANFSLHNPYKYIVCMFANSAGNLNTTISPGSYYLVFYNPNNSWSEGLEVTSSIVLILLYPN